MTLYPVNSESEAAAREKAILISSDRASFWRSVSCICASLKRSVYDAQHFVACEWLVDESACAARLDHLARRALNVGPADDHARLRGPFAPFVQEVYSVHPGHRQIEKNQVRFFEKVTFEGNDALVRFDNFMSSRFEDFTQGS